MPSAATRTPAPTRLTGRRLAWARALWWAVTLFYGVLFLAGLPVYFNRLSTVCDPGVCAATDWWVLTSAEAQAQTHWSPRVWPIKSVRYFRSVALSSTMATLVINSRLV